MTQPPNKDWLDDALQDDAYIHDAGFTAKVVQALPARRRRNWVRPVILGAATVAGVLLAGAITSPTGLLQQSLAWRLYGVPLVPVVIAVVVTAVSAKFATDEN